MIETSVRVHPTAEVSARATIGPRTSIWNQSQIREGAVIGANCVLGLGVYVDFDVQIGNNVKIQNRVSVFHGSTIEDGVFLGPHAILTNDRNPRAINADGSLKSADDWSVSPIVIKYGASIGAGAIVLPGVTVGRFALVGAGSVVSRDIPDFALVVGIPARQIGWVCPSGHRLTEETLTCGACGWRLNHA